MLSPWTGTGEIPRCSRLTPDGRGISFTGINIPDAAPELEPWGPDRAGDYGREGGQRENVTENGRVVEPEITSVDRRARAAWLNNALDRFMEPK